jgi:hypothetical protein
MPWSLLLLWLLVVVVVVVEGVSSSIPVVEGVVVDKRKSKVPADRATVMFCKVYKIVIALSLGVLSTHAPMMGAKRTTAAESVRPKREVRSREEGWREKRVRATVNSQAREPHIERKCEMYM